MEAQRLLFSLVSCRDVLVQRNFKWSGVSIRGSMACFLIDDRVEEMKV